MLALSLPTPEVDGSNPEPYVGKMVVSYQWSTTSRDMTYTVLKAT